MINMDIDAITQHHLIQQTLSTNFTHPQLLEPRLWFLIDRYFPQPTSDLRFWWTRTGIPLAILLDKAGCSIDAQCQNLLFFYCCVIPELGAGNNAQGLPRYWKSFMTDHFSPIELSWEWGCGGESPTIRFSIEPIGPYAGTPADPLNQYATARLIHQYQRHIQNCDLSLFDYFSRELLSYSQSLSRVDEAPGSQGHRSRTFIGVDFGQDHVMLKAYFFPTFKAAELGQSTWTIITQAVQNFSEYTPSAYPGLSILQTFLTSSPQGSGLETEMFAIDCVAPASSRLKIYMRSRSTSFDSVRVIMRLGGAVDGADVNYGLIELWKLWKLVFSKEQECSTAEDLQENGHRTAGILYYFDLKQGEAFPGVKVYLPVRHYGQSDLAIAEGLLAYLKNRQQGCLASKYLEALESICPASSLRDRCGIQTYLGCSIVGRELKLTSYVAPDIYKVQS